MGSDVHTDSARDRRPGDGPTRAECDLFGHPRRIALLEFLDAGSMVHVRNLARRVAAQEDGCSPSAVDPDRRRAVATSLVHNHLPRLADHGVIEWDREQAIASVPSEGLPTVDASLLDAWARLEADAFRTLAHPIRLAIHEILADGSTLSLEELAERLAADVTDSTADAEQIALDLRHSHLPAMAAVDLLAYDEDARTVATPDWSTVTR